MNINLSLCCKTCEEVTNCRIGMSNRDTQPFRFACQTCGSTIEIEINQKGHMQFRGADHLPETAKFDEQTNFVDLHLDFPVSFEKYVMGQTPFLKAIDRIGHENYFIHNSRLNALNELHPLTADLRRVTKLYSKNTDLFTRLCENRFGEKVKTEAPEDIQAALYRVIAKVFFPFSMPNDNAEAVGRYLEIIHQLVDKDKHAFDSFIKELSDSHFLDNAQQDCLEIYPRILEAELPLRAALFLDFDENYPSNELVCFRVSVDDFENLKDLYKDISEIMSRELVLVAGINNLMHRGSHNSFPAKGKTIPKSLNDYADVPFGSKLTFLDDTWYQMDPEVADNQLRNSIAHYKAEYDETTQVISYYPRREGIKQEKGEKIYFLDFVRKILMSYREMHRLHQLVKCLKNYQFFMYAEPD